MRCLFFHLTLTAVFVLALSGCKKHDGDGPGGVGADFVGTPTSGLAPLTVNFTDTSTGTVTSYEWDFDNDGTTDSTVQNPGYTYTNPGSYNVKLTVTGPGGFDDETKVDYITAYSVPVADFTASPTTGPAPLTVNFTDASTGLVTSWEWDFNNDGTDDSTEQNPSYTYASGGAYTVKLTVTGPGGSDEEVKVDYILLSWAIYVDGANGDDSHDGLSWQTAVKTIQKGIDLATNGWAVLVADGTYTGTGNMNLDFNGKAIHLVSIGGAENCIIDCENSGRGFYFQSGETSTSIVEGLTIQNGNADYGGAVCCSYSSPTITNCTLSGNSASLAYGGGGAVYCFYCNPTITNCTLSGNTAGDGGALYCNSSDPAIANCTFSGNSAYRGGAVYCFYSNPTITNCTLTDNRTEDTAYGGAVYCFSSSPTITNCTFSGNSASVGGAVSCENSSSPTITKCIFSQNPAGLLGGAVDCGSYSSPTITNCTLSGNSAGYGGAVSCRDYSSPTITNCTSSGNSAGWGGSVVYCDSYSNPTITNCTLSENTAGWGGGVLYCDSYSSPTITNCTLSGNWANYGGAVYCGAPSSPAITNSILWSNSATVGGNEIYIYDYPSYPSSVTLNNSDVTPDGYGGETGNITENSCIHSDPLFIDAAGGNYRLQATSLCIDAGDNSTVTGDYDVDGNVRLADGNGDTLIIVDMGAYEFQDGGNKAPVAVIESAPTGTTENSTPTFTYLGTDIDGTVAGYWVSIDVNPPSIWTTDTSWTALPLPMGFHTFYVQAQDDAGARSVVKPRDFIHDPTPDTRSVPSEYVTIQEAIDAADAGNTVLVSDGIYTGTGNKNLDFKGKAITVKSSGGAENCIIDCENSGRGFHFHSREEANSVVEGFTIRNGSADIGGAVYCDYSSPTITNCTLSGNTAEWDGGAVCCDSSSSPTITNCTLSGNTAGYGGAVYCNSSSPTITNCTLSGNSAWFGGAVFCSFSSPIIANSILWSNSATVYGNEVYILDSSSRARLSNSDVTPGGYGGTGNITENSCIHSDPLFVDAAGGNYRLLPTSPCIDAGDNLLVPAGVMTDLDGNARIQNGTVDMGAYEYQP
jgi:parallel beta-helix repeat protein